MSIVVHEVAHGLAALWQGDPTAKYQGRLTLNPVKHIDPIGSILVPILAYFLGGFIFGWAKPVPYNPYNLRDQKYGPAMVGAAGPLANIIIALVFGFFLRVLLITGKVDIQDGGVILSVFTFAIMVNVLLAFFNLIPFPPLDGSKLLFAIFPLRTEVMIMLEQYGFMLRLLFIFIFSGPLGFFLNSMLNLFFGLTI